MKNKLNFFDKIMVAATFAEQNEDKTALEILATEEGGTVQKKTDKPNSQNLQSLGNLAHSAE